MHQHYTLLLLQCLVALQGRAQNLTGENLKVVWAKFSTLSQAVFIIGVTAQHTQARPHLELKTRPQVSTCYHKFVYDCTETITIGIWEPPLVSLKCFESNEVACLVKASFSNINYNSYSVIDYIQFFTTVIVVVKTSN